MKPRNILLGVFFGSMVALGILVNTLFLLVALASLCGLMHLFGGHHGGTEHAHQSGMSEEKKETSVSGS